MTSKISQRTLIKKVNFLLSSVNLSLELLLSVKKRTIYKLLLKASKINSALLFSKEELKEIASLIADNKLNVKNQVKAVARILKLKVQKISTKLVKLISFLKEIIFLGTFWNKKQIIRV